MEKQRSKEWFSRRVGRITGSNLGAAIGANPWKKPKDLIREMVRDYHGAEREFNGNPATEYGQFHEPGAQAEYEIETGNTVEECGFFTFEDWAGASPDGIINGEGILEIKCPYGQRNKNPPEFKSVYDQLHYYAQIQWEMMCAQKSWAHFYQWSPAGTNLETVQFNAQWVHDHWSAITDFYAWYLSELDNRQHLEPKRVKLSDKKTLELVRKHDELRQTIENAKEQQKDILEELAASAQSQNAEIGNRKLTLVRRQGSVQYAKLVKEHAPEVDLEQYRGKGSEHWRLS